MTDNLDNAPQPTTKKYTYGSIKNVRTQKEDVYITIRPTSDYSLKQGDNNYIILVRLDERTTTDNADTLECTVMKNDVKYFKCDAKGPQTRILCHWIDKKTLLKFTINNDNIIEVIESCNE
jgi:hypothetical protein